MEATAHTNKSEIWQVLGQVNDPEMPISLVDMGLIYGVDVDDGGSVSIDLTFTSMGCPGMEMIFEDITTAVREIPGVSDVEINVVWSPPWTKEQLSPVGRKLLRAFGLSV